MLLLICSVAFLLQGNHSFAQQDPQYSQYMFNQMAINPAYAGCKDALSTAAFFRSQWTGIKGAPTTESVTIHGPLKKKKVGLAFAAIADQIGPTKSVGIMGSYAYRIRFLDGKLSFGLRGGIYNYTYDWSEITYKDPDDPYNTQNKTSQIVPTADAGMYYYSRSMYFGFSGTHLFNGRLVSASHNVGDDARFSPHFFFTLGKAWAISDDFVFSPSCMVKTALHSPTTADFNFSFYINKRAWVGLSLRTNLGMVAYTQVNINEKVKLGYSYDFGFSRMDRTGGGTHEIMVNYNFNIYQSKMLSPRYL